MDRPGFAIPHVLAKTSSPCALCGRRLAAQLALKGGPPLPFPHNTVNPRCHSLCPTVVRGQSEISICRHIIKSSAIKLPPPTQICTYTPTQGMPPVYLSAKSHIQFRTALCAKSPKESARSPGCTEKKEALYKVSIQKTQYKLNIT